MRGTIAAGVLVCALLACAPASAQTRLTLRGADAPGPARFDRVDVLKVGPARARRVLVLAPGTSAGAGYLLLVARDLVARLPGWQVWAVERRENRLEDHTVLDAVLAGTAPPGALLPYYLGWLGNPAPGPHFTPPDAGFARGWGMRVAVEDLRRVVTAARRGGRTVVLGGHSLGAAIATAYATWDFRGRAGARDLAGLVFIDGGSGPRPGLDAPAARAGLRALAGGSPFLDVAGAGVPWAGGVYAAVGATLARLAPDAPSELQAWPLLPPALKPPLPVTNAAVLGYALDTETGPADLALAQAHLGGLAPTGDPRGWRDGERAPVARVARAISGVRGVDGFAWFHPRHLSLDAAAIAGGRANAAQRVLGLRATRRRALRLPVYAFAASLGGRRVLAAARALAPAGRRTLVDRSRSYAHCDPLFAAPRGNDFLHTVVPFLRGL